MSNANLSLTHAAANAQESETPAHVPIYQPNGEPYMGFDGKEAWIAVLGAESKKYRQAESAITRRNMRNRRPTIDPSEIRRNRIDQSAACITDWNVEGEPGQKLECTTENAERLLAFEHILRQVEGGVHLHADFFAKSSSS